MHPSRKNEMLLIPRGTPYWFESSSKEPLVIMRFSARAQDTIDKRIDYTERKEKPRASFPAPISTDKDRESRGSASKAGRYE
jgi:hypothetical protein